MKLSMWSSYYWPGTPEEAILELEKYGWHYTELSDEHGAILLERGEPERVGAAYGQFARDHGVSPEQGHLWLKVPLCAPAEQKVPDILKRWLDLFGAAGIKASVLHCDSYSFPEGTGHREKVEKNAEVLRVLTEYLRGSDMKICLENLYVKQGVAPAVENIDQLLEVIECAGGGENLGICLDTGHLNLVEQKGQADFIRRAGKKLAALHLADNDGSRDQHLMPCGLGTVHFSEVFAALKEIGYEGLYNLEIPGERRAPWDILGMKLNYLTKMMTTLEERA